MKKVMLLIAALVTATAFATSSPYTKDVNARFSTIETNVSTLSTLANGKIYMGNGSNVAAEVTPSGDVTMNNAGVNAIAAGVIVNADVSGSAAIDFSKLAALTSGNILVGSAGNVAASVAMSGDATISNTGAVTIAAGAVEETMLAAYTADGLHAKRVARAKFDYADGDLDVGSAGLGVSLPAKAIITRSYIYVETQLADTGTCTLAISCEDANNIKTATDITGTGNGGFVEGESDGAASNFKAAIASTCEITATVADGGSCVPSAGKGTVFVEYVVHD